MKTKTLPPKKRAGHATGPRRLNGELWDVHTVAAMLGATEKTIRGQVARKLLPFKKLGGRIVFRPDAVRAYLDALPGVSVAEALENLQAREAGA